MLIQLVAVKNKLSWDRGGGGLLDLTLCLAKLGKTHFPDRKVHAALQACSVPYDGNCSGKILMLLQEIAQQEECGASVHRKGFCQN